MTYLLDTHALLWYLNDDPQLPLAAKACIEDAQHELLFSIASLWEIEIKAALGKLRLKTSLAEIHAVLIQQGYVSFRLWLRILCVCILCRFIIVIRLIGCSSRRR